MFERWKAYQEEKRLRREVSLEILKAKKLQAELDSISSRMAAAVIGPMDAQRVKRRDDAHYRRFIAAEFASVKAARSADIAALAARRFPGREERGNGSYGDYDQLELRDDGGYIAWRTLL